MTISNKSVYIYGPQGCGKTMHAEKFMKAFGLKYLLDGFDPETGVLPTNPTLILSNVKIKATDRVKQMTFKQALKKISN